MKKVMQYIFVFVFLSIITLPLVFFDRKSVISEQENRTLATFPDVIDDGKLSTNVIKKFPGLLDAYLSDRIGFKNKAIAFTNKITRAGKLRQGDVILGKNKWLYYVSPWDGDNLSDYLKTNLFSQDEISSFIEQIEKRALWCKENGIHFLFVIAPNKHSVYPEYYPFDRPDGITRTEQIINALPDSLKDTVIFPRDYIISQKAKYPYPFYYEDDTHWNAKGAYFAYEIILPKLKTAFSNSVLPAIDYDETVSFAPAHGDLIGMLGVKTSGQRTFIALTPKEGLKYRYIKKDGRNGVITENENQALPKALVFRDSFFSALEPFTSNIFSHTEYIWGPVPAYFNDTDKDFILEYKPDIIIWEMVERCIDGIPYSTWN
ncbi:MAG: hypothetical protein Ta2A_19490 [Treponemataceae bacterium]|nr:MAG: hypothetical protein Ta2A_19490 [Treponemataceae bacterium]